jgi:hypothetical protein
MSTISDPTQSNPATEARLEELAKEWSYLADQREPIDTRMEQIKNEYRILLQVGSSVKAAGRTISVQRNPALDPAAFMTAYPVMKFPHLYKSAPDLNAIKENLSPAEVRRLQKEGTPKVVIK